jgi:hypothetical protein
MKTTSYTKIALLLLAAATFMAASARADTYSWTNFQSDIPGVAQHVDENLVNPWGMAASANGTIWVSDNGTGVSTLYRQDGTAVPLVVTIPTAARNRGVGNPTGIVFNNMLIPARDESTKSPNPKPFGAGVRCLQNLGLGPDERSAVRHGLSIAAESGCTIVTFERGAA